MTSAAATRDQLVNEFNTVVADTDQYVHGHPWQSVAIGAGIAAVVGIVVGLLLNRGQ